MLSVSGLHWKVGTGSGSQGQWQTGYGQNPELVLEDGDYTFIKVGTAIIPS